MSAGPSNWRGRLLRRPSAGRARVLAIAACAALVAAAAAALAHGGSASSNRLVSARSSASPPPLDHFKCYAAKEIVPNQPQAVVVRDQFATAAAEKVVVKSLYRFCNPVKKRFGQQLTPIRYPALHLAFYWITNAPPGGHIILFSNQFGLKQKVTIGPAKWLAVPSSKDSAVLPSPKLLNHFQCYPVREGTRPKATVTLTDQWHTEKAVVVGEPLVFCNPAEKVHGRQKFPIVNPTAHLVCYRLTAKAFQQKAAIRNQFNKTRLAVSSPDRLCVPSRKLKVQATARG